MGHRRRWLAVSGGGIKNLVAPAITATAIIGTEITGDDGAWSKTPASYTYQWQRYTGGAWADIALATNKDYTPVDADFGLALRLNVTAGGVTANSNSTDLTIEAPAQSLGAELLNNGTFAVWTGDNPDGWLLAGESGSDPMVTQVAADGSAGTGAARLYKSSSDSLPYIRQVVQTVGAFYEYRVVISAYTSGAVNVTDFNAITSAYNAAGTYSSIFRAAGTSLGIVAAGLAGDFVVDSASDKLITLNTQLTAPSAGMRLDWLYTLPVAPLVGSAIWLCPRISDFTAGNYWAVKLVYTGTQWNINLYSVATHTATSRIAATNIGATDGIRINMNGDSISLYTTADGGTNWTQRGSTISNSTYNTATGVNALWTSDVTPGNLVYAAAS